MADNQQLNSLERFRKQSGRLVLEQHSHCEVPAGCGGVVLRWLNPASVVPVTLYLYAPVPATCRIDGAAVQSSRVDLAPGRHAVTVAIEGVSLAVGLLLLAADYDPKQGPQSQPAALPNRLVHVRTAADGSWKYCLDRPPTDAWAAPDFDDHDWPALVQAPTPQLMPADAGAYQCRKCVELGAVCLGLPQRPAAERQISWWQLLVGHTSVPVPPPVLGNIWVRKVFEVVTPAAPTQGD
jgi:hypothetical protein